MCSRHLARCRLVGVGDFVFPASAFSTAIRTRVLRGDARPRKPCLLRLNPSARLRGSGRTTWRGPNFRISRMRACRNCSTRRSTTGAMWKTHTLHCRRCKHVSRRRQRSGIISRVLVTSWTRGLSCKNCLVSRQQWTPVGDRGARKKCAQ